MLMKTEDPNFLKDSVSGAFINMNDREYKLILARREEKMKGEEVCKKMKALESELSEIKSLLAQVINGKK